MSVTKSLKMRACIQACIGAPLLGVFGLALRPDRKKTNKGALQGRSQTNPGFFIFLFYFFRHFGGHHERKIKKRRTPGALSGTPRLFLIFLLFFPPSWRTKKRKIEKRRLAPYCVHLVRLFWDDVCSASCSKTGENLLEINMRLCFDDSLNAYCLRPQSAPPAATQ